jgi:ribosome-binding factor A
MNEHGRGGARRHHKDLQLCRQVFDALSYALAELDDPLIDELRLASVVPAPSSARLLVTLIPSRDDIDSDAALASLRDVSDELREEVAAEVTRKRAPELVFRIGNHDDLQE